MKSGLHTPSVIPFPTSAPIFTKSDDLGQVLFRDTANVVTSSFHTYVQVGRVVGA